MPDEINNLHASILRQNSRLFEKFWHETMSADQSTAAPPPTGVTCSASEHLYDDTWLQSPLTDCLEVMIHKRIKTRYPRFLPPSDEPFYQLDNSLERLVIPASGPPTHWTHQPKLERPRLWALGLQLSLTMPYETASDIKLSASKLDSLAEQFCELLSNALSRAPGRIWIRRDQKDNKTVVIADQLDLECYHRGFGQEHLFKALDIQLRVGGLQLPGENPWIETAHTRRLEELIRARLQNFYPRFLSASLDTEHSVPWTIGLDLSMRMIPIFVRDVSRCESNLEALAEVYCEKLVLALTERQRAYLGDAADLGIECRQMRLPEQDADIKALEVHVTATGRELRTNTP